jgi:hypothetical protein
VADLLLNTIPVDCKPQRTHQFHCTELRREHFAEKATRPASMILTLSGPSKTSASDGIMIV